ncbi:MAG TPA: hypothetical protein VMU34_24335 [Mycobacterium sp.]|nr:hypothetical protein [Mycobacterium sp.]
MLVRGDVGAGSPHASLATVTTSTGPVSNGGAGSAMSTFAPASDS